MEDETLIGSIEAGGTKFICAVGTLEGKIIKEELFPSATPAETVPKIKEFFKKYNIKALGIATFGPVDLNPNSPTYGCLTTKIKPNWEMFNYLTAFKDLNIPIKIDTDVNGSCLGEMTYGTAKGINSVIYVTVGTGIGIGVCAEGKLIHGILHPEGGHIHVNKREDDKGRCVCPYHNSCLEGLASGPSLKERCNNLSDEEMTKLDYLWEIEADYLAQAVLCYIYIIAPKRIILGGGVMDQKQLFKLIREKVKEKNNGYLNCPAMDDLESLIVPASLNGKQGILGGLKLGIDALNEK